jgi:hypothetical protein
VTTTLVANANLMKDVTTGVVETGGAHLLEKFSPNFFENIRNGAVEIIRGMGESDPRKKTGGKKSRDTILIKYGSGKAVVWAKPTALEIILLSAMHNLFSVEKKEAKIAGFTSIDTIPLKIVTNEKYCGGGGGQEDGKCFVLY